jgi:hypothetical protein
MSGGWFGDRRCVSDFCILNMREKPEIRSTKYETTSKLEIQMLKTRPSSEESAIVLVI